MIFRLRTISNLVPKCSVLLSFFLYEHDNVDQIHVFSVRPIDTGGFLFYFVT